MINKYLFFFILVTANFRTLQSLRNFLLYALDLYCMLLSFLGHRIKHTYCEFRILFFVIKYLIILKLIFSHSLHVLYFLEKDWGFEQLVHALKQNINFQVSIAGWNQMCKWIRYFFSSNFNSVTIERENIYICNTFTKIFWEKFGLSFLYEKINVFSTFVWLYKRILIVPSTVLHYSPTPMRYSCNS